MLHAVKEFAVPPPTSSKQDLAELAAGNNAFALNVYGQFRQKKGNLFFSPASIWTAFGMAYAGAGGSTAEELKTALHFTLPAEKLHPAIGAFLNELNKEHPGGTLRVADALWMDQGLAIQPDFLHLTDADYGAVLKQVSFQRTPDPARLSINRWVEAQTENRIKDLLPPGSVDADTRLVLTNAMYFRGQWESEFQKDLTQQEPFHLSPSQSVQAPLMHREGSFRYLDGGTFQVLKIPYRGEMSLLVFLPKDRGGLSALEDGLTPEKLNEAVGKLKFASNVILTLPKFKATQEFELKGAMNALGVKQAFDSRSADFSPITGGHDLWISAAFHKAFIDLDEEGTEAAAATGLVMSLRAVMPPSQQPPIVFRADHPFLYMIRDDHTGCILFMGRVADPTK
jgi:serpin B